jgi:hypothetical protein
MTNRDTIAFAAGTACGLMLLGYLAERLIRNQLKSPVLIPAVTPPAGVGVAQRTYGTIVGGTRSERSKWFTGDPAT